MTGRVKHQIPTLGSIDHCNPQALDVNEMEGQETTLQKIENESGLYLFLFLND